jgi:hypothetical protein
VRWAAPAGRNRKETIAANTAVIVPQACLNLFLAFGVADSTTLLGRIGFVVLWVALCVQVATMVWVWLAIRWKDRNKMWP